MELLRNHHWIHDHLSRNNLLDKYCQLSKKDRRVKDAINAIGEIYGKNKPSRHDLKYNHHWIYKLLCKSKLIDKYCQAPRRKTTEEAIKAFKKIYGNKKPSRTHVQRNHAWIHGHFSRYGLLNKYCKPSRTS